MPNQSMQKKDKISVLLKYFTDGTADDDRDILQQAFVKTDFFQSFIDFSPTSPTLLVGAKGTGKSAILDFIYSSFSATGVRSLLIRPEEINIAWGGEQSSGYLIRTATECLARTIAAKLGTQYSGLLSGYKEILHELSSTEYETRQDGVQRLANGLNQIAKSVADVDFSNFLEKSPPNLRTIINAIEQSVNGSNFYLFIDDTDRITTPDLVGLNRIWAFILATRSLMRQIPSLRIAISLRSEIWNRLTEDPQGQQDQIDHVRDHVITLSVTNKEIEEIIERRFILSARELGSGDYISSFFDGKTYCLVDGEGMRRPWLEYIARRSRFRPRDAIQMVRKWVRHMRCHRLSYIDDGAVSSSIGDYSKERIDDLVRETSLECPNLIAVIDRFAITRGDRGAYAYSSDALNGLLSGAISSRVLLHGISLKPGDTFPLWKFLFEVGFISARHDLSVLENSYNQDPAYKHITSHDAPDFLRDVSWNFRQRYIWQVHPAYTEYLGMKKRASWDYGGIGK